MTVLLVILDATIVNIALPAVSADLEIDAASQQCCSRPHRRLLRGYTTAFTWAAALLVVGALVSAVLIKATKEDLPDELVVHAG